ncbi:damage-inducible protein DinB [Aliihoeflea sp. 40Bstr573]|nr:DinB family protein [Aliihoeflea sp. 40Bstr573]MCO6386150.1 damage-inducible protein DinB [Aliihoeflea sp. 40Bstr573]
MARNNRWSNHVLLRACANLDSASFTATRTSFFPSIAATLSHNHFVDLYYIDALEEGGRGERVYDDEIVFAHASELLPLQKAADERLIAFCDGLADADAGRTVITDRGQKGQFPERIADLLAHLFQHQIHHRGQAHAMLAGTDVKPPQLDEFFLDFERDPEIGRMGLA